MPLRRLGEMTAIGWRSCSRPAWLERRGGPNGTAPPQRNMMSKAVITKQLKRVRNAAELKA